jgi:hypothetical protein
MVKVCGWGGLLPGAGFAREHAIYDDCARNDTMCARYRTTRRRKHTLCPRYRTIVTRFGTQLSTGMVIGNRSKQAFTFVGRSYEIVA